MTGIQNIVEAENRRVKWGVLGSSPFLIANCYPELSRGGLALLVAVASRSKTRAESLADQLGVRNAFGSYRDLIEHPDIDVVYNALPNHLHVPWSIRALEAGKHVLCEKPLAMSLSRAMALADAAAQSERFLFEGYMWRHHPQWEVLRAILLSGEIGQAGYAHMHYGYCNMDPGSSRNKKSTGGGALLMIGCYPVGMFSWIFDRWPSKVSAVLHINSELKVDTVAEFTLMADDVSMTVTVSSQLSPFQRLTLVGDAGFIEVATPVTPGRSQKAEMLVDGVAGSRRIRLPPASQFALQADAVSEAVILRKRPDLTFGLRVLAVLDAVRASARRVGSTVRVVYHDDRDEAP